MGSGSGRVSSTVISLNIESGFGGWMIPGLGGSYLVTQNMLSCTLQYGTAYSVQRRVRNENEQQNNTSLCLCPSLSMSMYIHIAICRVKWYVWYDVTC